jgi:hypothetical protein
MSFRIYVAAPVKQAGGIDGTGAKFADRLWWDRMQAERCALPSDYEAEVGAR